MVSKTSSKNRKKILTEVKDWFKDRSIDDLIAMGVGVWAWKHSGEPASALAGMVGYKLARTEGGAPPISQISGLAVLSAIGLAPFLSPNLESLVDMTQGKAKGLRFDEDGRITPVDVQTIAGPLNPEALKEAQEDDTKIVRPIPWYPGLYTVEDKPPE